MGKQGSSQATTRELPSGSPSDGETELLRPFHLHLQREKSIPPLLLHPLLSDIAATHEETAALALRSLGYILHHENIVAAFSDESASAVLHSLLELITSTDRKALCSLAVWCLGIQEFGVPLLETQIHFILRAIVHAIDNPMGSKAITYEALQAVVKMVHKVPKMRSAASVWAPPVYKRLLSADKRDRDMAERCLKDVESSLLPPLSSLSKVVAMDINQTLLSIMEKMVKSRAFVVPTIRAWSWLVRLLGSQAGENRDLVNQMLKVAEVTFTSHDAQVQIASLVAWEALIDALFQYLVVPELQGIGPQPETDTVSPSCGDFHKSRAIPSVKRLKLLMMPLITIMSGESHESVRLACWHTWTYLAHKLEFGINSLPVQAVVVTPIFEAVFKSGPERGNPGVWDLCLNALEALIACKVQNKLDPCSYQAFSIGLEGSASSPKTPTMCKSTKNEAQSSLVIKWAPWSLESLESILRLVRVLWKCGVENYKKSSSDNLSLNGALRMLFLVIKGVEGDGKGAVKPSMQHVKSVHSLLRFVRDISWQRELTAGFKELVSVVWPAVEVLMELGSLVLSSSFYKLCFLHQHVQQNQDHFCDSLSTLDISNQKEADCMPISSGDLVTPIVYMVVIWMRMGCTVLCEDGEEEKVLERLEKLAESTKAGLGAMDNLRGVGHVLDWFYSAVLCRQETFYDIKTEAGTTMTKLQSWKKGFYFLRIWKIFAYHMTSYLESSNDVPAVESGISDSGYNVVHKFLLLPVQFCLHVTSLPSDYNGNVPEGYSSCKDAESVRLSQQGADELELVVAQWTRLFNCSSRISSLKSSQPNFFASAHCQKILKLLENEVEHAAIESRFLSEMLGVIIINVLRQTEISSLAMLAINRKKRLGSFIGGSCLSNGQVGNIIEDTSNVRDILCLTSRLLDLSWNELTAGKTWWFDSASRVLAALASFVARLYSQQDALMFLQDFSKPFSKWLSSSESSFIKQNASSSKVLMQALKNLWEKLLSCLERCQPPLIFDSNLLSLQAPLLIPAFQHSQTSISNSTLAFWEATYGSKASFLNYPSCLVPILHQLKDKVKISLPGWDKYSDKVSKGRPHSEIASEIVLGTPTGGRRQLRMLQEQGLERKKGSICRMASTGPRSKHDEICTSMNVHTSNLLVSVKSKHTEKPVDALLERIKRPVDNAHSIAVSTGVSQAGLDTSKDRASVSKDALTLMISMPNTEQLKHKPASGLADKIKADAHLFDKNIVRKRSEQSAKVKRKGEGVACRNSNVVQTIEGIPQKLAPNTAASIKPGEQLVLPCHDELAINDKDLLQAARNNDVTGSERDSGASSRRKKLRFLDDECLEYASIPLTQKMPGPLTDHQKEVRLAQSGAIGSACTSHGAGIKTYTSMDFSQSQVVLDSEDPEEIALQMNNQFVRGGEKLQAVNSSLMLSESHTKQTPKPLVNKDAHSDMVGRENMIVRSSEKGHSDLGDATPPELKPPYHHKSLLNEKVLQKNGEWKNFCGVDSAEHEAMHKKRSAEAGNQPHFPSGVQGLKPVTPSKILRSGKKLARNCETDNGAGEESEIAVSSSGTCPATTFCEIQLVNPLVPAQILVASGSSYRKGHKEPQNVEEDTRSRSNVHDWAECKASHKGSTSPRCAEGATQPSSDGHNCRESEVLEGDTQPVLADTQAGDTQPSDINRFMAAVGSDDKRCSQVTNALVQHSESNEDLTGQIGTKWAICDLLTALSSSSQWNSMDLESLECAQKLLSVLQGQVLESKGRLIASRSV